MEAFPWRHTTELHLFQCNFNYRPLDLRMCQIKCQEILFVFQDGFLSYITIIHDPLNKPCLGFFKDLKQLTRIVRREQSEKSMIYVCKWVKCSLLL